MANITKKGESKYLVRVYMGRDGDGRVKFHSKLVRGTRSDAKTYARKVETELDLGTFVNPINDTLDTYLDKWLEEVARPKLAQNSFEHYRAALQSYVRPHLGNKKLTAIRPLDITTLYNKLQKTLSSRTVRRIHSILSSAFKQAMKWGMMSSNPLVQVDVPKIQRREMQAISGEGAVRFLEAARGDRHFAIFALVLETGLRPSECFGLMRSDVNVEKSEISIRRTLIWKRDREYYFGEPKTSKSRRVVPLSSQLMQILKAHMREQAKQRLKMGGEYKDIGLLFAAQKGQPIRRDDLIRDHFKPILGRAKLSKTIRLYDLRHSCATILLEAGEHPKVVADRLGHASVVITLDTYSHVMPHIQRQASESIASRIFNPELHHCYTEGEEETA